MSRKRYAFGTADALLKLCEREQLSMAEVMLKRESLLFEWTEERAKAEMLERWQIMKQAAKKAIEAPRPSMGGLIGGEAKTLYERLQAGQSILSGVQAYASIYAMSVMEVNATMGLIVAAPTAGSSGVVPGALLALQEARGYSDEQICEALFTAAAVGLIIMAQATVAGAEGGCQAEIGASAAMAAAAAVSLESSSPDLCFQAATTALANLLGLVCDPIGGLVELPCQRRNAIGATNAIASAEMALAGLGQIIPFDEMVTILYDVGRALPASLRETALGGCAASPSACAACQGCG